MEALGLGALSKGKRRRRYNRRRVFFSLSLFFDNAGEGVYFHDTRDGRTYLLCKRSSRRYRFGRVFLYCPRDSVRFSESLQVARVFDLSAAARRVILDK